MNEENELLPTRQSLLTRLKDWNDQEGWKDFFDTYWRLIYRTALKAGLSEAEAEDVVQETVISVCKNVGEFEHIGRPGAFKKWLLQLTSWRVEDQRRKRQRQIEPHRSGDRTSTRTSTVERVADPASAALESCWDAEWETNLLEAAVARVKRQVDAKQYQVFDLYVFQNWPVARVARALKISPARVYLTKHRINKLLKKEIAYLRSKPI